MRAKRGLVAALAVASVLTASACTDDGSEPAPPTPSTTSPELPDDITFGVIGPRPMRAALQQTVDVWNAGADASTEPEESESDGESEAPTPRAQVELAEWPDLASFRADVERGGQVPDVFMASRSELSWLLTNEYIQPVDQLLDDRGVPFGDTYNRDAIEAFSTNEHLQCMPYGVSPDVVYYNEQLVDFERMRNRELDAPDDEATSWSFTQFAAAAEFASRPARGTKGVYVAPTIDGLAPFIRSGGGAVFNDAEPPTSLAFSSDGSRDALERTLELLRNPQIMPDEEELARSSAVRQFTRGKLGMIIGDRSLTPLLREVPGLEFDVLPIPRLDGAATIGDVTALCLSASAVQPGYAADFMVHEISPAAMATVTATGYLQPANVEVALSDDFLQPDLQPANAEIFNTAVRSMAVPALIDTFAELEFAVAPEIEQLVYGVGVLDLDETTTQIDETSREVLDPEAVTESPDASESPESPESE